MTWYRTGTVSVTNNSTAVTGSGTSWNDGAASGEAFLGPDGKIYEIASINSQTSMTLATAYQGSTAGAQTYVIAPTQSYLRDLAAQAAALVAGYAAVQTGAGAGKFGDGTLSTPGIRFTSDENTGIRRVSSDTMALVAGGVDVMTIGPTGVDLTFPADLSEYGIVTPATYGAVGNGTTVDHTAIQNFFNAVTTGGLIGIIPGGKTYLLRAGVTITLGSKGFTLMGAGVDSVLFAVDNLFTGATPVIAIQGTGSQTWPGFEIGGFTITSTSSQYGAATAGLRVGNPSAANPIATGYQSRTIKNIKLVNLPDALYPVHSRLIKFENVGAWNNGLAIANKPLRISQNGLSTGDFVFERCQFVTSDITGCRAMSIDSLVGTYDPANGNGSISGIKFISTDFYGGENNVRITASANSFVQDIWFEGGCQADQHSIDGDAQLATDTIVIESIGAGSLVDNIHLGDTYANYADQANVKIISSSTGSIRDIWLDDAILVQGGTRAVSVVAATAGLVTGIHMEGVSAVDCNSSGGAFYFEKVRDITAMGCKARKGIQNGGAGFTPAYLFELAAGCDEIYIVGNQTRVGDDVDTGTVLDNSGSTRKTIHSNNADGSDGLAAKADLAGSVTFTGGKKRFENNAADASWENAQIEAYSPAGATTDFSRIAFHVQDALNAPQWGYHYGLGRFGLFSPSGSPLLTTDSGGGDLQAPGGAVFAGEVTGSNLKAVGVGPFVQSTDTDGPTDKKYWRWYLDGGSYRLENVNDAYSAVLMTPVIYGSDGSSKFSGPFGYATGYGAGGSVTQATSKSTAVTLNKPCGLIATHNASLAAGAGIGFQVNNSTVGLNDQIVVTFVSTLAGVNGNYSARVAVADGSFYVHLTNESGGTLSEAVPINFTVIKGSQS